jgi:threonine dehydrogenase-like Zn-dependent dehydrogenase
MKAIRFNVTIPRYAFGKVAEKLYPPLLWSGLSCLYTEDVPEPDLPGEEWVKIKTRYGGVCGTDMSTVYLHTSTYYEPFSSSPFTLGHENVGVITEVGPGVEGWQVGERVIADPTLWCAPRGFAKEEWCEYCQKGETNRCAHVAEGALAPGLAIGACKDTGGSWSQYFTAHQSLLYRIPENVSDENAMLVEPFACGLHAALQNFPADDETVLIFGAGTIGLMLLAALRALGSKAHILVSARYPFQAEAAHKLGADEVLRGGDIYQHIAERTDGKLFKPIIGKRVLVGGVDRVYECVGKDKVLDDAIRLTKAGGNVVVVGVPGMAKGIDWAAIFDNELTITASYIYNHADHWQGETLSTYDIALELMSNGQVDIGWMVNRRYALGQYKQALREIGDKKNHEIIKAVFEFED